MKEREGRRREKRNVQPAFPAGAGTAKRHLLAVALFALSIFLAYSNSLDGTWAMDDILVNRPVGIKDIRDVLDFRKITYITFLLNKAIAPFSPANFRVFNILIHILNTLLVYLLAYKTALLSGKGGDQTGKAPDGGGRAAAGEDMAFAAALISGIVFALHPININAVAYIIQRMASLATLFVLLLLHCYIAAAQTKNRVGALLLCFSSAAFFLTAILAKENAVMAIPLLILYDFLFLSGSDRRLFARRALAILSAGALVIGIATYFLRLHETLIDIVRTLPDLNTPLQQKGWTAVDVYWTPLQHVLTEFRVLSRYLFLIFVPMPQFFVFDWWGFPVSEGIMRPVSTGLSMLLILSALAFSIVKMRRFPFLSFGILWYFIAISLESFLAIGSDLYFEHRNYLPVSGLIIGIAGQVVMAGKAFFGARKAWVTALLIGGLLGCLTFSRNFLWKDSLTLWGDAVRKNPSNLRALIAMGSSYLKLADLENAGKYYKDAVFLSRRDGRPHFFNDSAYNLGMLYLFKSDLEGAKDLIEKFSASDSSYRPKILSGFYKAKSNDIPGALKVYREISGQTEGMDTVVLLTLMGDAYRRGEQWDDAIRQYEEAISRDPGFSAACYGAGASYMGKRDLRKAEEYFRKTLSIDGYNVLALSDLADLLVIKRADPLEALDYARRAVSKAPPFYEPYMTAGTVLMVLGREKDANDLYRTALEKGMPEHMVPFSKARAYHLKGESAKADLYLSELGKYRLPERLKELVKK